MSWPVEHDLAAGRLEQPHHAAGHRRLAAARLADHAERLALADRERHAVDGAHAGDLLLEDDAARDREVLLEILDGQQIFGHPLPFTLPTPSSRPRGAPPRAAVSRRPGGRRRGARSSPRPTRTRLGLAADVHRVGAAQMEAAARRRPQQRRRRPGDRPQLLPLAGEPRQRPHEPPRVGVMRLVEDVLVRALLGRLGRVHHQHLVGRLGDHAEVVRDQDDGASEVALQVVHQASGSGPGWSRRAPWSARRRSAGRGC